MRLPGAVSLMGELHFTVPSSPILLLSLLFSLVVLALIRTVLFAPNSLSTAPDASEKLAPNDPVDREGLRRSHRLSLPKWNWRWEGLPISSPISISPPHVESSGQQQQQKQPQADTSPIAAPGSNVRVKSSGPAFDHPLPAIYETEVPVSMAKMIMSRHTIRKPTMSRSRSPAPAVRRLQSMV